MPKNPHADFTPSLKGYSGQEPFRFWCQMALPLTYDDSLSYYELLCKVVNYLNNVITDVSAVEDNVGALADAYTQLQNYVNNYFDELDVEAELRNVLDAMAEDGTLDSLLSPLVDDKLPDIVDDKIDAVVAEQIDASVAGQIDGSVANQLPSIVPDEVSDWLDENVDPVGSAVIVDSTLSISGAAADAKVTGDKLDEINSQIEDINDTIFTGDSERNISTLTNVALSQASTSVRIGETLTTQKTYKLTLDFSAVPSKLYTIQTARASSASTVIDTIHNGSTGGSTHLEVEFTPTEDGAEFIRINFVSSYTGDITTDLVLDEINIPLETSFYTKSEVDESFYTKSEIDESFYNKSQVDESFYSKSQVDESFYTKPQIDERIKPANKFNINTTTFNAAISSSNGEVVSNTLRRFASDYIDVTGHTTIAFSQRAFTYAFYDENKAFIEDSGGSMTGAGSVEIPTDAYYVRFTGGVNGINDFIVTFDDETTNEKQYGYVSPVVGANIDKQLGESNFKNNKNNNLNIVDVCDIISVTSGSALFDYVYRADAKRSIKMVCSNGVTQGRVFLSVPVAIEMDGVCAFKFYAYISGANNITNITWFCTPTQESLSGGISVLISDGLRDGWNTFYAYTYKARSLSNWDDYSYFGIEINTSGNVEINISNIDVIKNEKAKIIVTDDHGFQEFLTYAYPTLKTLKIPTTWGMKWGMLGAEVTGWGSILTEQQIETLSDDPYSEFSFHSWAGGTQSEWNDMRIREDMQKCITAMRKHGVMPLHLWRSAWVQNTAYNVSGIYDMLEGSAYYSGTSGTYTNIPFPDIYNISRLQLHSSVRDQAWFNAFFDRLKKTHCSAVVYTHSIVSNDSSYSGNNMTENQLNMFLTGCTTGVNEGWLEGTTFSWEMTKYYSEKYKQNLIK